MARASADNQAADIAPEPPPLLAGAASRLIVTAAVPTAPALSVTCSCNVTTPGAVAFSVTTLALAFCRLTNCARW